MDHPYLFPDDCPWEQDYHDLRSLRNGYHLDTLPDDDDDFGTQGTSDRLPFCS